MEPLPIRLRDARFEDHAAVATLLESQGLASASREQWAHLWRDNPALADAPLEHAMGWVLERDGEIGGYLGNIITRSAFGDRDLTTAVTTALAAAPDYRAQVLKLITRFYKQPHVDLHLCTTANAQSGPVLEAFKAKRVPQPKLDTVAFWVINPGEMAAALLRRLGAGPLARIAEPLGVTRPAWNAMHRPPLPRRGLSVGHLPVESIGEHFDRLWQSVRGERPRLLGDRSSAHLRWHLSAPSAASNTRLLACHRDARLAGYLTTRDETGADQDLTRTRITDFVVAGEDLDVATSLLWHAYEDTRMRHRHVLELRRAPRWIRELVDRGRPFEQRIPYWPCLWRASGEWAETLADEASWMLTDYDGDSSL